MTLKSEAAAQIQRGKGNWNMYIYIECVWKGDRCIGEYIYIYLDIYIYIYYYYVKK